MRDGKTCPTCLGKGEVYAEAPWARWFDCADCEGTGRPADSLFDGSTPLCKADPLSVCTCDKNDLPGRCPRLP